MSAFFYAFYFIFIFATSGMLVGSYFKNKKQKEKKEKKDKNKLHWSSDFVSICVQVQTTYEGKREVSGR